MRPLTSVLMAVMAIANAIGLARERRRAGIRTDWTVTLVAGAAAVVLALALLVAVLAGLQSGHEVVGAAAGVAVFVAGMVVLGVWSARRRRRAGGLPPAAVAE